MVLIIDNYDSFTYNLYQLVGEFSKEIEVYRNDGVTVEEVIEKKPTHIILSPGAGYPKSAGICIDLISQNTKIPLLGVCLGHQAIVEAFGGEIIRAPRVMHGKSDMITISLEDKLFSNLSEKENVGRYHSLVADRETLPKSLQIIAESSDGCVMGVHHVKFPIYGIQFHPESILTPNGKKIIQNFLNLS